MNPLFESVQLSVSNNKLDCHEIVKKLSKSGINASVTKNKSIICDEKKKLCN